MILRAAHLTAPAASQSPGLMVTIHGQQRFVPRLSWTAQPRHHRHVQVSGHRLIWSTVTGVESQLCGTALEVLAARGGVQVLVGGKRPLSRAGFESAAGDSARIITPTQVPVGQRSGGGGTRRGGGAGGGRKARLGRFFSRVTGVHPGGRRRATEGRWGRQDPALTACEAAGSQEPLEARGLHAGRRGGRGMERSCSTSPGYCPRGGGPRIFLKG